MLDPRSIFGSLTIIEAHGQQQEFILSKRDITVGRAASSDIVLNDKRASRAHVAVQCTAAHCVVTDAGSANGFKLNGVATRRAELKPGDRLTIGTTTLVFQRNAGEADDVEEMETQIDPGGRGPEGFDLRETLVTNLGETAVPRLVVIAPGRTWEVDLSTFDALSIGRLAGSDILIDSPRISRRHARIERTATGFVLRDLNSDNGTWVSGQKIETHHLADTDTIHIGETRLVFKAPFAEGDLTVMEGTRAGLTRRPVVVIPGFMGSNLWQGDQKIWPGVRDFTKKLELMRFVPDAAGPKLEPRGLVDEVVIVPNVIRQQQYGALVDYLEQDLGYERGRDLWEFAYDFRQDLRTTARQLAAAVEGWAKNGPVTIIAHSMGSLISRFYVNRLGGDRYVERQLLLGGPHAGSPKAVTYLATQPSFLPFGLLGDELQQMMLTFPAIYHLLPEQPCGTDQNGKLIDWLHDSSWLPPKYHPFLKEAASFRSELAGRSKVSTLCIFGYGMKTMTGLQVQRQSDGMCTRIRTVFETGGDGTVPESMALLKGVDIHPIQQYHGTLHIDQDVKKRLKVELTG